MAYLRLIAKSVFLFSLIGLALGFWYSEILPDSEDISELLYQEPRQTPSGGLDLVLSIDGYEAQVDDLFEYEIYGLVVEEYSPDNWLDYSHKHDPFNTRDLCLLWGENLKDGLHQRIKFSHGEFTCFFRTNSGEIFRRFRQDQISNNHLIPADEQIARAIKQVRTGDQVRLKGYLADLRVTMPDGRQWTRQTSTIRHDTGNGACEIILAAEIEVIRSANAFWRLLYFYSWLALALSVLFLAFTFLIENARLYYGRIE